MLIHAAGGGVGIAATQIANRHGAEIYGTASPSKHERIRELGVEHAIDYTRDGWESNLPKFDLIMDALGGASFRRSYNLLRPGGRLVAFGASAVVSGEKRNPVSALRTVLRMPRFNMIKQMSDIEGRDRPEHAEPLEGPRDARAVDRAAARAARQMARSSLWWRGRSASRTPARRTG